MTSTALFTKKKKKVVERKSTDDEEGEKAKEEEKREEEGDMECRTDLQGNLFKLQKPLKIKELFCGFPYIYSLHLWYFFDDLIYNNHI